MIQDQSDLFTPAGIRPVRDLFFFFFDMMARGIAGTLRRDPECFRHLQVHARHDTKRPADSRHRPRSTTRSDRSHTRPVCVRIRKLEIYASDAEKAHPTIPPRTIRFQAPSMHAFKFRRRRHTPEEVYLNQPIKPPPTPLALRHRTGKPPLLLLPLQPLHPTPRNKGPGKLPRLRICQIPHLYRRAQLL